MEGDAILRDQHCRGRPQWIDGAVRMEVRSVAAIRCRVMFEGRKGGMRWLSGVGLWLREGSEECGGSGYQI